MTGSGGLARRVLAAVSLAPTVPVAALVTTLGTALATAVLGATAAAATPAGQVQAWARTGAVPTFVAEADRLYIAADVGVEQARSFVALDIAGLSPTGSVLLLREAPGGRLTESAGLAGCPLTTPVTDAGELTVDAAPAADCTTTTAAVRAADGAWTLPLDAVVAAAVDRPIFGVALVPVVTAGATFHVVLDPALTGVTGARLGVSPAPRQAPPAAPQPLELPRSVTGLPPVGGELLSEESVTTRSGVSDAPTPLLAAPETVPGAVPVAHTVARSATTPPAYAVLPLVALVVLAAAALRGRSAAPSGTAGASRTPQRVATMALPGVALGLPLLLGEANIYKVGLVLVLLVGAIGMHLLVNWAGELSLAHASFVGLPAFVVATTSANLEMSPILLVPLGVVVGALTGAVVGLPAIRARGLQVALVTLAGGVAIDRFFFTREAVVGPAAGAVVPVPTLGPLTFATARSLYPVLMVLVVVAIAAAWVLYRSKLVRGMLWIKADPAAAAAFGIPVARYRTLAYVLAGGFAGYSGALTATWVQRLTPQAFPVSNSFTYLIIVAVAGRGFIGGVAAAAAMVEGGRLFLADGGAFMTYAGPIGLILTLTKYRGGLNGLGARLAEMVHRKEPTMSTAGLSPGEPSPAEMTSRRIGVRPASVCGAVAVALGFTSIALAWYHAGNTTSQFVQTQELISGGIGGIGLVIVGVGLVIYDRLALERAATAHRWERVLNALERSAAAQSSADAPWSSPATVLPSPPAAALAALDGHRPRLAATPR